MRIVDVFFFFNDTATTEIYTLSLHDALPILARRRRRERDRQGAARDGRAGRATRRVAVAPRPSRSEEHTSELQSRQYIVCRLLLEKKKKITLPRTTLLSPRSLEHPCTSTSYK